MNGEAVIVSWHVFWLGVSDEVLSAPQLDAVEQAFCLVAKNRNSIQRIVCVNGEAVIVSWHEFWLGVNDEVLSANQVFFWIDDRLYSAILRSLEQTHCARM